MRGSFGAPLRRAPKRVVSLRRHPGVVVVDRLGIADAASDAGAELQILERTVGSGERMRENAPHHVETDVDVQAILPVTHEPADLVGEVFVLEFTPGHHTNFFVGGNAEVSNGKRALHERDVFVARSVLHRERSVELTELEVQRG